MKPNYRHTLPIHLYPVIYGVILLLIINYLFSSFINSLLYPTKLLTMLRFFEILEAIINNIHLVLIAFLLIFIEVLRVAIINAKALILVEAFLLFIYCWSIEIMVLYLVLSCLYLKIIQNFIPRQEIARDFKNLPIKQNMFIPSHSMNSAISPRYNSNPILIIIGFCIGIHVIYSYFLTVNLLSMIIYVALVVSVITRGLKYHKVRYQMIDVPLAIIPPFGVIPVMHKIFFSE